MCGSPATGSTHTTPAATSRRRGRPCSPRTRPAILPIQFALAGMNAHIEHDLPLAVIATCAARGCAPDSPGVHADYEKINDVLASVEEEIRRGFLSDIEKSI